MLSDKKITCAQLEGDHVLSSGLRHMLRMPGPLIVLQVIKVQINPTEFTLSFRVCITVEAIFLDIVVQGIGGWVAVVAVGLWTLGSSQEL